SRPTEGYCAERMDALASAVCHAPGRDSYRLGMHSAPSPSRGSSGNSDTRSSLAAALSKLTRDRPNGVPATAPWRRLLAAAPWLPVYGGLTLVLAVTMWPAWFTTNELVVSGDALLSHYPWQVLWRDALAEGEFPFWNPYTFSGLPAFATLQAGYGYPLTWL